MMERSLVLLKPDCVQRRLVGRVISRFEEKGLNIIAMKLMAITPELARQHYAEHIERPFYPGLETYITGGSHDRHGRRRPAGRCGGPEDVRGNQRARSGLGHHPRRFQH